MKIYIDYTFKDGPYGGANQFLKGLRDFFVKNNYWCENPYEADCIIINHTNLSSEVIKAKTKQSNIILIHRMDGPVSKHRQRSKEIDKQSFWLDKVLCEGTVYQSEWTYKACMEMGMREPLYKAIVHNAPNSDIFYKGIKEKNSKIKLIATSWSDNWNKGFDVLEYLDNNLDFQKYQIIFVGRSPIEFKNIICMGAMDSYKLADVLRTADIYLAISRNESCSNSLIEAIKCGLPIIARDSGCYREIIKNGGIVCKDQYEILKRIDEFSSNLSAYIERLPVYDLEESAMNYYLFAKKIYDELQYRQIRPKRMTCFTLFRWYMYELYIKIYRKLMSIWDNKVKIKKFR